MEAKYGNVNEKHRDIFYMRNCKMLSIITEMTFGIYTYTDTSRKEKAGNQNWNVTNSKTENQSSLTEF